MNPIRGSHKSASTTTDSASCGLVRRLKMAPEAVSFEHTRVALERDYREP
jgi:hypothetical protein